MLRSPVISNWLSSINRKETKPQCVSFLIISNELRNRTTSLASSEAGADGQVAATRASIRSIGADMTSRHWQRLETKGGFFGSFRSPCAANDPEDQQPGSSVDSLDSLASLYRPSD